MWVANKLNMEIDGDSVLDGSDLLIQRNFGIKTNSNMVNSMAMFTFSV